MKTAPRIIIASIVAVVWVAALDGVSRALSGGGASPSAGGVLVVFGCALLVGAVLGLVWAALAAAAQVAGPARGVSSGVLERLARAPWWVLLAGAIAFFVPILIAVPVRAVLLPKSAHLTAAVDVAAVAAGWAVAWLVVRALGSRGGRRISGRLAGWVLAGLGVAIAAAGATQRPGLESADLWNLFLVGDYAIICLGVAFLVPERRRLGRLALALAAASVIAGAVSLCRLDTDAPVREEVAADWRPASWIVSLATAAVDSDGDGFSPLFGGGDCDDRRDDVNPEGIEIAGNGVDENCRDGDSAAKPPWPPRPTFLPLTGGIREPKSVIIIVMDALRRDHLGVYGYERPTSPNIDAFSAKAMRFERAYSSAPTTRIALPVLFTGRTLGEIPWDRRVYPYAMLDNVDTLAEILKKEQGFKSAAFITHRYMSPQWGWVQGFDEVNEKLVMPRSEYESAATGEGLAKEVTGWIERHSQDRFLVWAHFLDPHSKYLKHADGPDFGDEVVDRYDSEVWYTDKWVGTVLAKLDELGIGEDTMVVLMADHGELFGEHGRKDHGGAVWETVARIPLIIRAPGMKPGANDCLTGHIDLAPTILNLVGIDGGKYGMSGATLLPELSGAACDEDREIVLEMRYGRLTAPSVTALLGYRYKLVMNNTLRTFQIFDLEKDPDELRNVAGREKERLEAMKSRLLAWNEVYANREIAEIISRLTSASPPASAERVDAVFENGVELVAIDFGERRVSMDVSPDLQLFMRTSKRVRDDCDVLFFLDDDDGDVRFESKHPFINGTFPVRQWPLGRVVNDGFAVEIRSKQMRNGKLTNGEYEARIGLECDGAEIPAVKGDVDGDGRVRVGRFRVGGHSAKGKEKGDGSGEE
jgi:arylsulfatase A-like enzyme